MQFRQWTTFFNSPHSRLPQTPILFQQSVSLMELMGSNSGFGSSAFISFVPEHGAHGFSKPLPQFCRRFYPLVVRGVSAHHNDQAQDRAPCDKTRSPGADLPHNRESSRVNEKLVLRGPALVKRFRRSAPLLLTGLYRPVVRQKPNHALYYFCVSLFQGSLSLE